MELILWRHAEAEDGWPDMERALTAKGLKQAEKMAAFLHPRLPPDTLILVSPAKRTQQTAQALARPFLTEPLIAPTESATSLLQAAEWPHAPSAVLLVGHQPSLGAVAARLLAQIPTSFSVKKGALWWFSQRDRVGETQAILRLVIAPEHL